MKDSLTKILLMLLIMSVFFTVFYYMDNENSTENTIIYSANNSSEDESEYLNSKYEYDNDYDNNYNYNGGNNGYDPPKIEVSMSEHDELISSEWEGNVPQIQPEEEQTSSPTEESSSSIDEDANEEDNSKSEEGDANVSQPSNEEESSSMPEVEKPDELVENISAKKAEISQNTPFVVLFGDYNVEDEAQKNQILSYLDMFSSAINNIDQGIISGLNAKGVKVNISINIPNVSSVSAQYSVNIGSSPSLLLYEISYSLCMQQLKNAGVHGQLSSEFSALNPADFVYGQPNFDYINQMMFLSVVTQRSLEDDIYNTFLSFQTGSVGADHINANSVAYQKYQVLMRYISSYV